MHRQEVDGTGHHRVEGRGRPDLCCQRHLPAPGRQPASRLRWHAGLRPSGLSVSSVSPRSARSLSWIAGRGEQAPSWTRCPSRARDRWIDLRVLASREEATRLDDSGMVARWLASLSCRREEDRHASTGHGRNAPNCEHLEKLRGFGNVKGLQQPHVDGPRFESGFSMSRRLGHRWLGCTEVDLDVSVTIRGLGYSLLHARNDRVGVSVRQLALPTPVDGESMRYVMVFQCTDLEHPGRLFPGLCLLPKGLVRMLASRVIFGMYRRDVSQDFEVWARKQHLVRPGLTKADGPILEFRWSCLQFYDNQPHAVESR